MKRIVLIFSLLLLGLAGLCFSLPAEDSGSKNSHGNKKKLIYSPIVYYTPETDLAYGAAGSMIFHLSGSNKHNRPSSISPLLVYTQKKQLRFIVTGDFYVNGLGLKIYSRFVYQDFPEKFFGVGRDTLADNNEIYNDRRIEMAAGVSKRVWSSFSVGLKMQYDRWNVTDLQSGGKIVSQNLPGSGRGHVAGMGVELIWDTRDNIYSASSGEFFEARGNYFIPQGKEGYSFSEFILDLRKYFRVFRTHVLALRTLTQFQSGDVPFQYLARFGGQYSMRGYYDGRFRNKAMTSVEAEYRLPVFWRIGAVVFAGMGDVAPTPGELNLLKPKFAYGGGVRLVFDKKERIVVRVDVGFGHDSSGIYFSIYEAF